MLDEIHPELFDASNYQAGDTIFQSDASRSAAGRLTTPTLTVRELLPTRDSEIWTRAAVKLAPSILAADFARLGEQVAEAESRPARIAFTLTLMDGHFVPNLSMGAPIVQSLRRVTDLPLETHLMILEPGLFSWTSLRRLAPIHSSFIGKETTICTALCRASRALGKRAGVAINPATPAALLEEILPDLDQVLVMTVNPGFGHQHFLQSTLPKIRRVSQMIEQVNPECALEVDWRN